MLNKLYNSLQLLIIRNFYRYYKYIDILNSVELKFVIEFGLLPLVLTLFALTKRGRWKRTVSFLKTLA